MLALPPPFLISLPPSLTHSPTLSRPSSPPARRRAQLWARFPRAVIIAAPLISRRIARRVAIMSISDARVPAAPEMDMATGSAYRRHGSRANLLAFFYIFCRALRQFAGRQFGLNRDRLSITACAALTRVHLAEMSVY